MRLFFETEFLDDGPRQPLTLISIGLVAEDGREYYAESAQFLPAQLEGTASGPWLRENVLPHLSGPRKALATIADEVYSFAMVGDGRPELWGSFCAYDWVLLCQLYGRMLDLPPGFRHRANDIQQLPGARAATHFPPHFGRKHHALDDARHIREVYRRLTEGES